MMGFSFFCILRSKTNNSDKIPRISSSLEKKSGVLVEFILDIAFGYIIETYVNRRGISNLLCNS